MLSRRVRRIAGVLALVVALAPLGCDDDEGGDDVGAPCRSDDECSGVLECDFHGGPIGTCQSPHMHTTGSGSGDGSSGDDSGGAGSTSEA